MLGHDGLQILLGDETISFAAHGLVEQANRGTYEGAVDIVTDFMSVGEVRHFHAFLDVALEYIMSAVRESVLKVAGHEL